MLNKRTKSKPPAQPPAPEREKWLVLGHHTDAWGKEIPVGVPLADMTTHGNIIGTTGSGKTTLMGNQVLQVAMLGGTVVVLEPHGEMILDPHEGILARLPPWALHRVTVIDLNATHPPQFNVAAMGLRGGVNVAVDYAMNALRNMEPESWDGLVRGRQVLRHALNLLLKAKGAAASMSDLYTFLDDAQSRRKTLQATSDKTNPSYLFWEKFEQTAATKKDEGEHILDPARRRVDGFLLDDRFRWSLALPILHPQAEIRFDKLLAQPGRIILVPFQSLRLGENVRRVFGTLFLDAVINACMSRKEHHMTVVFMDEMGDLAGVGDIDRLTSKMFAETRKYKLGSVFATQYPAQLPKALKQAAESLTGLKIILNLKSGTDAKEALTNLATPGLRPDDILNIEKFHGYARTTVHKATQPTYSFKALPPLDFSGWEGDNRIEVKPYDGQDFTELDWLHKMAPEEAIAYLVNLRESHFQRLVHAQAKANRYIVQSLLQNPGQMPNQVEAALAISRYRHGFHWTWYEAQYRRLRRQQMGKKPERTIPTISVTHQEKELKATDGEEV